MPKSAKKSASKAVSTPAAAEQPTQPTKNGKRDAEEIVEKKVVNGKKQKIVNGGVIKKKNKAQKKKNKKQENIISDSDKEDEEEKEEAMNGDDAAKNEVDSDNESGSDDDENAYEEDANDASEPASKEEEGGSDDVSEGSEEEDSSEEEDEPETTTKKTDAPQTPATGSKTLFVGNLSFSVKEDDLVNFFKDAGEVLEVRLAMRDGRFSGYGHVEFTTPDAAQKALELNNELLLDRAVRLDLAREKGAYTPGNERSSQKSGQSQVRTVFVRGFGTDDGFDDVRSSLEEHFGKCGEISRMSIPKDSESGGPKGVAFIDFADNKAFSKALDLSGSEVSGGTITVEEAKQRGGDGGFVRGGRGGGRGDRFGGGRGGGRGDRFGGGRGGGRGDRFGGGRGGGRGRGRGRGRR